MVFVIAGSIRQFEHYCREHNIRKSNARYIYSLDMLYGIRNVKIVLYGTYWENEIFRKYPKKRIDYEIHIVSGGNVEIIP